MNLSLKKAAVREVIESLLPSFEWALPGLKVKYRNLGLYSGQWLAPSTIVLCEESPTLEAFFHELLHVYCYVSGLFERFHTTAPTLDNFDEYFEEALQAERFVENAAMELCSRIFPEYVWEHEAYREFREQEILYNDLLDQANQNSCLSRMFKGRKRRPNNKEKETAAAIKLQNPIEKLMNIFTSNPELLSQAADIITVAQETTAKVEQGV